MKELHGIEEKVRQLEALLVEMFALLQEKCQDAELVGVLSKKLDVELSRIARHEFYGNEDLRMLLEPYVPEETFVFFFG